MTLEELKAEAEKHGYKLIGENRAKTPEQWEADKAELRKLRKQRTELKSQLATISKRIHILSTSITQYEKKCVENARKGETK